MIVYTPVTVTTRTVTSLFQRELYSSLNMSGNHVPRVGGNCHVKLQLEELTEVARKFCTGSGFTAITSSTANLLSNQLTWHCPNYPRSFVPEWRHCYCSCNCK